MAAPTDCADEFVYATVSNIPEEFHSKDLRNYFSQFVETGGFECFHFKHRPERKVEENEQFAVVTNDNSQTQSHLQVIDPIELSKSTTRTTSKDETFFKNSNVEKDSDENPTTSKTHSGQSNVRNVLWCVVRLYKSNYEKLIKMYRRKNWVDSDGNMMPQLCHISEITVIPDSIDISEKEAPPKPHFFKRRRELDAATVGAPITRSALLKLPELNPPDIMPQGNVGTMTSVFSQLISECRLPPKVVKRLGIVFPKSRTNKRYGNVSLDYGGEVYAGKGDEEDSVVTAQGQEIGNVPLSGNLNDIPETLGNELKSKNLPSRLGVHQVEMSPPESEEDEDSGEEWDRHEALHNDVTNQERTTERLFENDMEVTWDKGSSGLVFYTDAAYWDKQEGDFDEKTTDDWDVDMSAYYDPDGGDKDARDFIQMRREQQRMQGVKIPSVFKPKTKKPKKAQTRKREMRRLKKMQQKELKKSLKDMEGQIGYFEKHTKGFGRKLMEAQGWVEGVGLGKAGNKGITTALFNEGKDNFDKRGIGYYGKKLKTKNFRPPKKSKTKGERTVIISTIYDDPKVTDPPETLLRSQEPYSLKYIDRDGGDKIPSVFKPNTKKTKKARKREMQRLKKMQQEELEKSLKDMEEQIGYFEKHTKGFGRKLMKAQGWVEGEGLGKAGNKGITTALFNKGKDNFDKRGVGYYGKKLKTKNFRPPKKSKMKGERTVIISTIYDDPKVTDPPETLARTVQLKVY